MSDEFDGYVTKYALTAGIQKMRLVATHDDMVRRVGAGLWDLYHGEGREWHRTYESARQRAEAMRDAKIKSLRKSLDKMQALTFSETMGGEG